ncbi:MAG TPA: TPM domain-containing protein, partial [Gemmatimonadales bacterium]|nr:TPM domain-containing protein [Gemmatimonadales bacterium]
MIGWMVASVRARLWGPAILAQLAIPSPVGYVNDFAHVLDPAAVDRMDTLIAQVRVRTRGEIAVVTLPDIGDREASDVAVQIGRAWGVGAKAEAGNPANNLGVVLLLVPRQAHRPGSGQLFIATGRGAEGFLPDSRVGRIRDAMTPDLAREDYSAAAELGVGAIAQAFADEFGVSLAGDTVPSGEEPGQGSGHWVGLLVLLLVLLLVTRGRLLFLPLLFGGFGG